MPTLNHEFQHRQGLEVPRQQYFLRSSWECRAPTIFIWYLVSYGILGHNGNFSYDTSYKQMNKYCHEWWMSSFVGQNPTFFCQQVMMRWTIVMDDWNMGENHLVIDNNHNTVNLESPKKFTRNHKWCWVHI